jgi:hypothetical protein
LDGEPASMTKTRRKKKQKAKPTTEGSLSVRDMRDDITVLKSMIGS